MRFLNFKVPLFVNKRNNQVSIALPKEFKKTFHKKPLPKYVDVKVKW